MLTSLTSDADRKAGHLRRQADAYRSLGMDDVAELLMRRAAAIDGAAVQQVVPTNDNCADARADKLRAAHETHLARVAAKHGQQVAA